MRAVVRGSASIGICGGVGLVVGLIGWVIVAKIAAPNAYADSAWVLALVSVVVGIMSGVGLALSDIVRRDGRSGASRRAAISGAVAVVVLGLIGGGLSMPLAPTLTGTVAVTGAIGVPLAGCALVGGLIAGGSGENAGMIRSLAGVWLGVLCGVSFALGFGLETALTFSPPCPPYGYCLEFGRWYVLQALLPAAALAGLAIGITMCVAIGVVSLFRRRLAEG